MAKGKVLQTIIDISGEISPTLGKSLDEVSKHLEGVNVKAMAAGAAITGIAIGTGVAVAKAGKYLANLGNDYNSAMNDIAASTGLVGEELESMSEALEGVYGYNFGESMEDVAAGLADVYRNTGLVGEELEATTKAAYALSDTFGYDIAESSRAAKAMMTNFGISGEEAMGLILDLAIELPVYQRSVVYAYNSNVIKADSLPSSSSINPFSSPLDRIWEVEFAG